jgi:hypothetical protein
MRSTLGLLGRGGSLGDITGFVRVFEGEEMEK